MGECGYRWNEGVCLNKKRYYESNQDMKPISMGEIISTEFMGYSWVM